MIKRMAKYAVLLWIGGQIYYDIELLWRGHSSPWMMLVGGICFILCGMLNEYFDWRDGFFWQILVADALVILVEFVSGIFLNVLGGLHIWDYSGLPLNMLGQICVPYMLLWLPLCAAAIVLDDWLRYWLFHEERPRYYFTFTREA